MRTLLSILKVAQTLAEYSVSLQAFGTTLYCLEGIFL